MGTTLSMVADGAKQRSQNQLQQLEHETKKQLGAWLRSPKGRLLVQHERRQLRSILPKLFGYRLVQIGAWGFERELFDCGETLRQWVVGQRGDRQPDVYFDGRSLPLTSKCLDAVILPHTLDLSRAPHQLLREVDRVLCDRGQVLLLGFNPWSFWAGAQRLPLRRGCFPMAAGLYTAGRVHDWLDLLDYDVVSMGRYGTGFPRQREAGSEPAGAGWQRLSALFAQAYWVLARKRVVRLTPVLTRRHKRAAIGREMPEPTRRNIHLVKRERK